MQALEDQLVSILERLDESNAGLLLIEQTSRLAAHREFAAAQRVEQLHLIRDLRLELQAPERMRSVPHVGVGLARRVRRWAVVLLPGRELRLLDGADAQDTMLLYLYLQTLEGAQGSRQLRDTLKAQQSAVRTFQRGLRELRSRLRS